MRSADTEYDDVAWCRPTITATLRMASVTIASAVFSKGTRYRRHDWQRLNVFRNSKSPRSLCFADHRDAVKLPAPNDGGKWKFWASFSTTLRGHIVYSVDVHQVREEVRDQGYALRDL